MTDWMIVDAYGTRILLNRFTDEDEAAAIADQLVASGITQVAIVIPWTSEAADLIDELDVVEVPGHAQLFTFRCKTCEHIDLMMYPTPEIALEAGVNHLWLSMQPVTP